MRVLLVLLMLVLTTVTSREAGANDLLQTSEGGVTFVYLHMPKADKVSLQLAWPTNWPLRGDVNQAVPYIGADLILQAGAEGYSAGIVTETFADLKAVGQLWVATSYIFGSLTVPEKALPEAVKIANAHLRAPALEQSWLDRIKKGLAASITEAAGKPEVRGFKALRWYILGDSSLRLAKDPDDQISAVTRDDVVTWYRQTLLRNTPRVVVAGPLTAKEAGVAVDALLSGLPMGQMADIQMPKPNILPKRILLHVPDAPTSTLSFIAPFPPTREGKDYKEYEDMILLEAIGGGDQSVLFDEIRTKLRATYAFGAGLPLLTKNMRLMVLTGQVDTKKLSDADVAVRSAYGEFRQAGLSDDMTKRKAPFAVGAERNEDDASIMALAELLSTLDGREAGGALRFREDLDKVDKGSVDERLKAVFPKAEDFIVIAVSPDRDALPGACVISQPREALNCR